MRWLLAAGAVMWLALWTHHPYLTEAGSLAVFLAWLVWCFSGASSSGTRTAHGHGVTREETAYHEAGHFLVAKLRRAGGVRSAVYPDGRGWTEADMRTRYDDAIVTAAGTEATNLIYGRDEATSRDDASDLRGICRGLDITPADAARLARQEVAAHLPAIRRLGRRLNENGRI